MFEANQDGGSVRWYVVKIHVRCATEVILLGDAFLPLTVHWCGKTVPCGGDGCVLCSSLPGRGLFYLPVNWDGRVSILELGVLSANHLEQHCKLLHGGMKPGQVVRLTKRTLRAPAYSEVIDFKEGCKAVSRLELAPRVMRLYQLPGTNPGEGLNEYSARVSVIAKRRAEVLQNLADERLKQGIKGQ